VLALAERTRQLPPLTDERPARRGTSRQVRRARRVWFPRISVAVAAVATAVAVVLGVSQIHSQSQLGTTQSQLAAIRSQLSNAEAHNHAITAVLAASDARLVSSKTSRGGNVTAIVSPGESKMVVLTSSLPALPASEVYELWLMGPTAPKPSGLLSQLENGQTQPVLAEGPVKGYNLGITVEPAGGTLRPTTAPIVVMPLTA
jgi:anti-sigma-K factor RskA